MRCPDLEVVRDPAGTDFITLKRLPALTGGYGLASCPPFASSAARMTKDLRDENSCNSAITAVSLKYCSAVDGVELDGTGARRTGGDWITGLAGEDETSIAASSAA